MGCLSILHDSIDTMKPEEIKDMIKTALASGNHMINLLNDILNKSKNKYLLNKTVRHTVYYEQLANEACGSLKALAKNLEISFEHTVTPSHRDIVIATDRTKIIQIVSNVVNNALKFSTRGKICAKTNLVPTLTEAISELEASASSYEGFVCSMEEGKMCTSIDDVKEYVQANGPANSVSSHASGTSQEWMCLSVADSGCGMKPTELEEMFEPYTQAQADARSQPFVGSGLGLFICVTLSQQVRHPQFYLFRPLCLPPRN